MTRMLLSVLMLAAATSAGRSQTPEQALTFVADLRGQLVAPAPVETTATAKATGVLVGNRFTVHGSFSGLSSPLRDIAKKPDDPGVHLHRGAPGETSPYFHGLQVRLNADERSGILFGTATLDEDQLKRLLANGTYVDIHTVKHPASCGTSGGRSTRQPLRSCRPRSRSSTRSRSRWQREAVTDGEGGRLPPFRARLSIFCRPSGVRAAARRIEP